MFNKKFTILSAELSTLSESENAVRTDDLRKFLIRNKFDFRMAEGCYKGETEVSFVVDTPDVLGFNQLYSVAKRDFNQESVLYVDEDSKAILMYGDMFKCETIGTFTRVNPKRLEQLEAYTVVNNAIYAAI